MTMGIRPTQERVLDGKHVFILWLKHGTLNKVGNALVEEGIVSPRNPGVPVSNSALNMSSWRYAIRNPEESFKLYSKSRLAAGVTVTRDEWNVDLIVHARTALTPAGYIKFLKKNGLEEIARSVR